MNLLHVNEAAPSNDLTVLMSCNDCIRKFGGEDQVAPEVNPFFHAMFQLFPNMRIILANLQTKIYTTPACG